MASLRYDLIPHKMADVNNDLSLVNDGNEITLEGLKSQDYGSDYTVMTSCDNFITMYGYSTWKKKFGGR